MEDGGHIAFHDVVTISDFWEYLEFVVIPMLHGDVYNQSAPNARGIINKWPILSNRLVLNENLLLGSPRLRQVRVKEGTCHVHRSLTRYFNECYAPYTMAAEFTEPVYKG